MNGKETVLYDIEKCLVVEFLMYLDEDQTIGVYETEGYDLNGHRYHNPDIYIQKACNIFTKEI